MTGLVKANSQIVQGFGSGAVISAVTGTPHVKAQESLPCLQWVTRRRQTALSFAPLPE